MQSDIEQLKTQIQTPESDPAKAIDLATQIIAQARFHIWRSPIGCHNARPNLIGGQRQTSI